MPTIRFDLNREYSDRLEEKAKAECMTVQEYIRSKLFPEETIFTVKEVVRRVRSGVLEKKGKKEFTVPDVYTDEEWEKIDRGSAGALGRSFFNYVNKHPELGIRFIPDHTINRRAAYKYETEEHS